MKLAFIALVMLLVISCQKPPEYDLIIRNGNIYDGSGAKSYKADLAISGDTIAAIGDLSKFTGKTEVDANGLAVSPGFINMLSWANESLIEDGRSLSDLMQGVTTEIMGEGWSMGPLNDKMKKEQVEEQGDIKYKINWTSLKEYLDFMEKKGISCNVASFVGSGTVRIYVLGYEDRAPNKEELEQMKDLVKQAMEEGALGVGSSLIYAPLFYAKTDELIELCKGVSQYGGMYISHIRSEGDDIYNALNELIRISKEAKLPAEIYHIKAAGKSNWNKLDSVFAIIENAQKEGLKISADMYTYNASATGLDASMPPWVQEGGLKEWKKRLQDPKIRKRVIEEMKTPTTKWENSYLGAGSPDRILLVSFRNDSLKYLTGKTLSEVAKLRGKAPEETAMDLVIDDESRVGCIYFSMNEENIRKKIAKPWISFGSDEGSLAPEGVFLKSNPHPRAYGNIPRLLGKYVREEKIISLEEAIRRLTSFPAENLKLKKRGKLRPGYFADVVVFDPNKIIDKATFDKPHQLAVGILSVFVNGVQVIKNGEHTNKSPGKALKGPGYRDKKETK
jgi:N-acyl-D-amino-acid deacylase